MAGHKQLHVLMFPLHFLHVEVTDEVYIKIRAGTLRLTREEQLPPFATI